MEQALTCRSQDTRKVVRARAKLEHHRRTCHLVMGANPHRPLYQRAIGVLEKSLEEFDRRHGQCERARSNVRKALCATELASQAADLEALVVSVEGDPEGRWGTPLPPGYLPAAPIDQIGKGYVLRRGQGGASVGHLQKLLSEKGYFVEQDQLFGPRTEKALVSFQRREGLKLLGVAGPETLARLAS